MGFLSGNRPKPKPFGFIPRYYDEQKEELENRLKAMDNPDDISATKDRIKSGLRATYRGDAGYKKSQTKKANMRLIYIIATLFLISYLILRSNAITNFMEKISG